VGFRDWFPLVSRIFQEQQFREEGLLGDSSPNRIVVSRLVVRRSVESVCVSGMVRPTEIELRKEASLCFHHFNPCVIEGQYPCGFAISQVRIYQIYDCVPLRIYAVALSTQRAGIT